jgi:hypothetical protein
VLDPSFQSCQKTRTCLQALRAGSSLSLSLNLWVLKTSVHHGF